MKKRIIEILGLLCGSLFFAIAINVFIIPSDLGEGGVTGITIILYYLYGWSPSMMNLLINGILLIAGFKLLGKKTVFYTILFILSHSLFLHSTENWVLDTGMVWIQAAIGGILSGVGIGLIFRCDGTSAGTAILAKATNKFLGWKISYSLLFFDVLVVLSSIFIIGFERAFITIFMLYISTKAIDITMEGIQTKKLLPAYVYQLIHPSK